MPQQPASDTGTYFQEVSILYTEADGLPVEPITRIAVDGPDVLATSASGHYRLAGSRWERVEDHYLLDETGEGAVPAEPAPSAAAALGARCSATDAAGNVWTGAGEGIKVAAAGCTEVPAGATVPPLRGVQCIALAQDGAVWAGSPRGAACLRDGKWRYYGGRRWLPDDRVNAIAVASDGGAWLATDGGVARIERRPMTLLEKADHFEQVTSARHDRRGYVTECELRVPGDLASFRPVASDNDGLWTALYICAECFRYATTKEEDTRARAQRSMEALLHLVDVTGLPGFPARAVASRDEDCGGVDRADPNWQRQSAMDPNEAWKGDTSSDEIDGHYLAWYVYDALVASEAERARIREACRAVTDHILDHGFYLVGPEGHPTTWGVWAPERINDDPAWHEEHGLNSLEVLCYLRVAMHLCGEPRFETAYRTLIEQHHYALNTLRQKVVPPEGSDNHSDDELAWCAYYPLLMLETDPALRRLYLASLERTWHILRPQGSPFHNLHYGALTGRPCDVDTCVAWLEDAPWDLVDWRMVNRHRPDVKPARVDGRFGESRIDRILPPSERGVARWNSDPYVPDRGSGGRSELDPAFWLLPYWFGRYHGLIAG